MKKRDPKPKSKKFTDEIEEWMIGQPSDKDSGAKTKSRIRKGKAATQETESRHDL